MLTQLAGFENPVQAAQKTFRGLLNSLSRPGIPQVTADVTPPDGLNGACGAACLTLLDLETTVWLQPGFPEEVRDWLVFHAGCYFTEDPQAADFAVIWDVSRAPDLATFSLGTSEYPEASTSLLIQVPSLEGGEEVSLRGPGILDEISVSLPLSHTFWSQWQDISLDYPLGLDCWCFAGNRVVGLPRTAQIVSTPPRTLAGMG
ncbi:phosphonate C-P lyase system protein PhnH [Leptothoe sp. PORK10 BA2]|uniref:phosphonate C-P lyase system protein PhnH n=1 Tax=Leptothoe sp. PORK10 BA2 TaxID=3110254 RepID=UPI002B205F2A|nr:phosphonate C-P lyase system protein PhnH [Leptothoe sp. PORK10 BA2]MEA5465806.1 phosphonate C-P lyase system protein PhnH [Leptothoe sp. PORK10 BA2]